jgi:hypothetical protein
MSNRRVRIAVYGLLTLAGLFSWLRLSAPLGPAIRDADSRGDGLWDAVLFWRPAPNYIVHHRIPQDSLYLCLIVCCALLAFGLAAWDVLRAQRRQTALEIQTPQT